MFLSKPYESFVAANSRHQDDQRHGVPRRNGLAKTAYYSGEFRRTQRGDQSVMGLTCNPDAYGRALQSQCEVRSDVNSMPNYRRPSIMGQVLIVLLVCVVKKKISQPRGAEVGSWRLRPESGRNS